MESNIRGGSITLASIRGVLGINLIKCDISNIFGVILN